MKKILALFIAVHLCAALCSCGIYKPQKNNATEDVAMTNGYRVLNYENMKGVWLSQYDLVNIYTVDGKQRDVNEFTTYMERVLDKVAENALSIKEVPHA